MFAARTTPAPAGPLLEECEGTCGEDDDCKPGLICYQHRPSRPQIGCAGIPQTWDYCLNASDTAVRPLLDRGPDANRLLGLCEGDCDSDFECMGALVCFKRRNLVPVPGCIGYGTIGWDYCVNPWLSTPTTEFESRSESSISWWFFPPGIIMLLACCLVARRR